MFKQTKQVQEIILTLLLEQTEGDLHQQLNANNLGETREQTRL